MEDESEEVEAMGRACICRSGNDVSLQVQQVEDLISQGIDAMFLNPAEAEGILPALDALKKQTFQSLTLIQKLPICRM